MGRTDGTAGVLIAWGGQHDDHAPCDDIKADTGGPHALTSPGPRGQARPAGCGHLLQASTDRRLGETGVCSAPQVSLDFGRLTRGWALRLLMGADIGKPGETSLQEFQLGPLSDLEPQFKP